MPLHCPFSQTTIHNNHNRTQNQSLFQIYIIQENKQTNKSLTAWTYTYIYIYIYIYIHTHIHIWTKAGLFFSFFWIQPLAGCTGDHPQEELAKFGYRSERKVEQFKNHAIFIFWNLLSKYDNFRKKIAQTLVTLALFFSQKFFLWACFFLFVAKWRKSPHIVEQKKALTDCCRFIESAPL